MTLPLRAWAPLGALIACMVALVACYADDGGSGGKGSTGTNNSDGFISDNPFGSGSHYSGSGSSTSSSGMSSTSSSGDPSSPIAEADVIKLDGGRLYALSRYGGLSIIDASAPDALPVLGRHLAHGAPFEMYLRDGTAYVLYEGYPHLSCTGSSGTASSSGSTCETVYTSRVEAIDVHDPANIVELGAADVPGNLADSRMVGDVLYVVTYESGSCWGCTAGEKTIVRSFDVSDPASIAVVDEASFTVPDPNSNGWWQRTVVVSEDRMYVAAAEWDGSSDGHSTIQIVDISDPAGHLAVGASVTAKGQIERRWQMDEQGGVLRVISQPASVTEPPTVQTFQVDSAYAITPLAELPLALPPAEPLTAVRFDGDRAFGATSQASPQLFTVDLSDPAHPVQLGSLTMPGPAWYLEPHGDRLLSLGTVVTGEKPSATQSAAVSLLDVADLAHPATIQTVQFGVTLSGATNGKSFVVDEANGAVFAGFTSTVAEPICASAPSGIQILDYSHDALAKRGVAAFDTSPKRVLVHEGRLFGISDLRISTFDITNRDAPQQTASLTIVNNASQTVIAGTKLVRLGQDWITCAPRLEVVPLDDPTRTEPLGVLDLSTIDAQADPNLVWDYWNARLFATDDFVYMVRRHYIYPETTNDVVVFDVSNAAAPTMRGRITFPTHETYYDFQTASRGDPVWGGAPMVLVGSSMVFLDLLPPDTSASSSSSSSSSGATSSSSSSSSSGYVGPTDGFEHASFEIINLGDPDHPTRQSVALAPAYGHTALIATGAKVRSSHWGPLPNDASKVRFYIDELDFAAPSAPVLSSTNVPGSLLAVDAQTGRVLTVSYQRETKVTTWDDCLSTFGPRASFKAPPMPGDNAPGECSLLHRTAHAVKLAGGKATILDSLPLDDETTFSDVVLGDDRVFLLGRDMAGNKHVVLGGLRQADLQVADVALGASGFYERLGATGHKLVLHRWDDHALQVLDATSLDAPAIAILGLLPGSYFRSATLHDDEAICSLGENGVAVVSLTP